MRKIRIGKRNTAGKPCTETFFVLFGCGGGADLRCLPHTRVLLFIKLQRFINNLRHCIDTAVGICIRTAARNCKIYVAAVAAERFVGNAVFEPRILRQGNAAGIENRINRIREPVIVRLVIPVQRQISEHNYKAQRPDKSDCKQYRNDFYYYLCLSAPRLFGFCCLFHGLPPARTHVSSSRRPYTAFLCMYTYSESL